MEGYVERQLRWKILSWRHELDRLEFALANRTMPLLLTDDVVATMNEMGYKISDLSNWISS